MPPLPAAVQAVAFSPDGKFVAAGLADNSIHIFDLAMGKDVKTLAGHAGPVTALAYTAKGELVVRFGGQDGAGMEHGQGRVRS